MTPDAAVRPPLSAEARGLVEGLAAALPPADGTLLLGLARDGLPLAEVAARIGVPPAVARARWLAICGGSVAPSARPSTPEPTPTPRRADPHRS